MKKLLTLLALLSFINIQSHASILLEPYLNYNFGSGEVTEDGVKSDYDSTGLNYGGRIGYQTLGFMAGLDAQMGSVDFDIKTPGESTTKNEYDSTRFGLFVGYDFPILLRAWATYYFTNTLDITKADGVTFTDGNLKGSAIEFGVGFTPLPLLSVNLGYRMNTWDEATFMGVTETTSGDAALKVNEIFLGVSLPLTF